MTNEKLERQEKLEMVSNDKDGKIRNDKLEMRKTREIRNDK